MRAPSVQSRGRRCGRDVWILSLVVVFERDLGTSLIFLGAFVITLYVATERTSRVVFGVAAFAVGAFVVAFFEPHVDGRVVAWLHPMGICPPPAQRPTGLVSDRAAQALFSFGPGGMLGTGLGQAPEPIWFAGRSDFILTTVGGELGLTGVTGLIPLIGEALWCLAQRGSDLVANWLLVAVLIEVSYSARRPRPPQP
ncbi:FtsW/RodA/SpoVE family cell cycle protein [Streptomyces sp. NPDC020794]|uniref:FtsW/RodA/SpoVE family cell cycle protein n=1 Tax=unclassified Streptomyces TaxID=2593676 RepID=UPI0036EF3F4C